MNWRIHKYISCWIFICLLVITVGCGRGLFSSGNPVPKESATELVNVSQDPEQVSNKQLGPFTIKTDKGNFTLTPMAEYRIDAMIVGTKQYSSDWNSQISPMDLALAWGGLAKADYNKYIEYEQRDRWYYYRYNKNSPFDSSYISNHSSNNHIIPATENLKRILLKMEVKQAVLLQGYLVNVDGASDGRTVWWRTSLTRTDTGNGACEIIYVKKAVINGLVYE